MYRSARTHLKSRSLIALIIGAVVGSLVILADLASVSEISSNAQVNDVIGGMAEYLIYAVSSFLLFWFVLHRLLRSRQIARRRWPRAVQISRELAMSLCSQIVMVAVGIYLLDPPNIAANLMSEPDFLGWVWLALFTFLLFVVDDTTFYWSHRALHHPFLFRHIHAVHHDSVDPTPFTAMSFHPLEAIMHSVLGLVIAYCLSIFPWHPVSLMVYGTGSLAFNIIGHLGYELYPAKWNQLPGLRWKTPALHHYLHHQMVGGNFALYFRWWDRWCRTEFPDFEARYDRIFADPVGRADEAQSSKYQVSQTISAQSPHFLDRRI